MGTKPSSGGGKRVDVNVDVHVRPIQGGRDLPHVDTSNGTGVDPRIRIDNVAWHNRPPGGDADLDLILPAPEPKITIHSAPIPTDTPPSPSRSLEDYWIKSAEKLPEADSEGFRVHKGRQYVDVSDGGTVPVGTDPNTGQYRARRSNELTPTGPLLLRDSESGLWYPHYDFNANTVPLTEARLRAFRTELNFEGVEVGNDGLFRHDDKLYAVIHEQAYQVMEDLDASTPNNKVWRLVNPKDPVATDSANIYRASRSGETRAITRNEHGIWVSILTGLRGGMDPDNPNNFHRPWLPAGEGSSGGAPRVVTTTRAQVKHYFPDSTDQHADDFIARFGETTAAEVELKRLQLGYPQFDREIRAWETGYRGQESGERNRRIEIGATIRRLYKWQGETSEKVYRDGRLLGFKLKLQLGTKGKRGYLALPVFQTPLHSVVSLCLDGTTSVYPGDLKSMFSHIETLEVRNFEGTKSSELLAELKNLPNLRVLDIRVSELRVRYREELFTGLSRLQELHLENCSFYPRLSVRGMNELRVFRARSCNLRKLPLGLSDEPLASRLQVIDLHHNYLTDVPDVSRMSDLRVLDLSYTGIQSLPLGLSGAQIGPLRLEVMNLEHNTSLVFAPSLHGVTALREVILDHTQVDSFPFGITSEIPRLRLSMVNTKIASIPETIELRKGFDLTDTPISDPASLRRLVAARRQTGTDIWLGRKVFWSLRDFLPDISTTQHHHRIAVWNSLNTIVNDTLMLGIRHLVRTPEFQVERQILQSRIWSFLEHFHKAGADEQEHLREIAAIEPSPGKMLDRLEEEIRKFDPTWQHEPEHHLPKRPRWD